MMQEDVNKRIPPSEEKKRTQYQAARDSYRNSDEFLTYEALCRGEEVMVSLVLSQWFIQLMLDFMLGSTDTSLQLYILKLVLSLIISKLDNCNSLFYNMSLENIHKLQLIQNHAARLVKKASKRSSAKLLFKDLHWLPVKDRIIYKIAVLVFKIINNKSSPSYLRELINLKTFVERSFSNYQNT